MLRRKRLPTVQRAKQRKPSSAPSIKVDNGLLWFWAYFHKFNGYGDLARYLVAELIDLVPLAIQTDPAFYDQMRERGWWDHVRSPAIRKGPHLSLQPTFSEMLKPRGEGSAMFTMCECDRLLPIWCRRMDEFDLVIVPNNENAMQYRDMTKTPIVVVNQGIDFEHYHWKPFENRSVFRFGTAGHLGHGATRKGLFRVVEWFREAFPSTVKDVRLSIKLSRGYEKINTHGDDRIELIPDDLSTQELADWHHSIDVYADGSTYEGWGMFPCNSLACGRPVIGVYYGGHREYFRYGNHIPIGYNIELADEKYQHLEGAWAIPDRLDGIEAMRWCYDNPGEILVMGHRAARSVEHLTWRKCAEGVIAEMRKAAIIRQ